MTSIDEMRVRTINELAVQLLALKKEQFNLRFQKASGQLENTARVKQVRRAIARVKTVLRERNSEVSGRRIKENIRNAKAGTARGGRQ